MRILAVLTTTLVFLPNIAFSMEQLPPPLHFLSDSSFQIASSMKLGAAMGEMSKPTKGGVTKEVLCESDEECSEGEKCESGTCINVCDPNPCPSGYCVSDGSHSYSCVPCLNDSQCGKDEKCRDYVCVDVCSGNNCIAQHKLCISNGNHDYTCGGCTSDEACADDEFCDTSAKTCRTLCPDSCEGNLICEITGPHEARCICEKDEDCPEGYTCDQETKQCVAADCAGMLLASRDDVAVAVDAASFSTAMSSGKNIIAVTENLTVSSAIDLGSKKLVGPKYFADIPVCKEMNTPTVTASDGLQMKGGEISDLNTAGNSTKQPALITGYGTINNAKITNSGRGGIRVSDGHLTLSGTVDFDTSSTNIDLYNAASATSTANLTLTAKHGNISVQSNCSFTAESGSLKMDSTEYGNSNVYVYPNGKATFNIPIEAHNDDTGGLYGGSPALNGWNSTAKIVLAGNGNKLSAGGINAVYGGGIDINGSTEFTLKGCESYTPAVFGAGQNLEGSTYNFNAPVTVKTSCGSDLTKDYGRPYLFALGKSAKFNVNAPIKVSGNLSLGYFSGGSVQLGAKGEIGNVIGHISDYNVKSLGSALTVKSGGKLTLNNTCKKATSNKSLDPYNDFPNGTKLPSGSTAFREHPSVFSSGC